MRRDIHRLVLRVQDARASGEWGPHVWRQALSAWVLGRSLSLVRGAFFKIRRAGSTHTSSGPRTLHELEGAEGNDLRTLLLNGTELVARPKWRLGALIYVITEGMKTRYFLSME